VISAAATGAPCEGAAQAPLEAGTGATVTVVAIVTEGLIQVAEDTGTTGLEFQSDQLAEEVLAGATGFVLVLDQSAQLKDEVVATTGFVEETLVVQSCHALDVVLATTGLVLVDVLAQSFHAVQSDPYAVPVIVVG
jgi:hypothetical protein